MHAQVAFSSHATLSESELPNPILKSGNDAMISSRPRQHCIGEVVAEVVCDVVTDVVWLDVGLDVCVDVPLVVTVVVHKSPSVVGKGGSGGNNVVSTIPTYNKLCIIILYYIILVCVCVCVQNPHHISMHK